VNARSSFPPTNREEAMGATEAIIKSMLAQMIGEVEFLDKAVDARRFDLSDSETLAFVGRLLADQIRALYYLAGEIDDLKAASLGR
jgi:hypothetical protein